MPVITLLTDWTNEDYYLGALKGKLLKNCPEATIIDLSHSVSRFNSAQAAFILKNSYKNFPENTVHLIGINCEEGEESPFVIIKAEGQFFIGPDNGMFGLVFKNNPEEIIQINTKKYTIDSFPELNILSEISCKIAAGEQPAKFGVVKSEINRQVPLRPTIDPDVIMGSVIYIDTYLNAIVNITKELFEKECANRKFSIYVGSNHYEINKINTKYNETQIGELLALFNSSGLLEIAINKGQACNLLNIKINSHIRIKFYDNKNR
ncbi:MAG: SAM-dependent chlorinase/fluorinase [Chlorobi bacterium]|nr:SAM-dependent chlorinase/fluorinase [Chlorobiota bacterium]